MTDVYATAAESMVALRKQVEELKAERDLACQTRDAAQAASNKSLLEKREMAEKLRRAERAVAFAKSAIMSGERWTDTCEDILGGVLKG